MTEGQPACDAAALWAQIVAQDHARVQLAADALPANKAALLDALAAADITSVVVTFDGCGDSGQIESIDALAGETVTDLPAVDVEIATPPFDGSGLDRRMLPLAQAIEDLAYDLLRSTHCGWEINGGSFGEFTFNVGERSIQLDYNERIESSEYHAHSW